MPKYKMYVEMVFETATEFEDIHAEGTLEQTDGALQQMPPEPPEDVDPSQVRSIVGIKRL